MFQLDLKGPWKRLVLMMRNYDLRFKYAQQRVGVDIVEALVEKVKDLAPKGREYKPYIDSLEAVQLVGGKDVLAFGVISRQDEVAFSEVMASSTAKRTVVYVTPVVGKDPAPVVELVASANPWPASMIPYGLKKNEVDLIHRVVSVGEAKDNRARVKDFVAENKSVFRQNGLKVRKTVEQKEELGKMSSLPDYMWLALRAEFGINADPRPHWRPAIQWVIKNIHHIVKRDDKIRDALHDPMFRDHTFENNSGLPMMPMRQFDRQTKRFQERIVS